LSNLNPSRAEWRVRTGALLTGLGLGLGLGAVYLAGGMAKHAVTYAHSQDLAAAAAEGYAGEVVSPDLPQTMMRMVQPQGARQRAATFARAGKARELECLADAVYYEARGEGARGQFAVAQVVMNRVKHPAFPKTVCGVVFQGSRHAGCQFSFACDGSMRGGVEGQAWRRARRVAARALTGAALAEIGSATHFHTTGVSPAWGLEMARVAQVGEHIFYRFSPRKAAAARAAAALRAAGMENAVLTSGEAPAGDLRLMSAVVDKTLEAPAQATAEPPVSEAKAQPAPATGSKPVETTGASAS
jgi:spore germination cell wall hydrolase CwlJ-like protein